MRKYYASYFVLLLLVINSQIFAQNYTTWRSENQNNGNTSWQDADAWYSFTNTSNTSFAFGQQEWDNNVALTQQNNADVSTWRFLFKSGANQAHTFNGNQISFFDFSGQDPKIENLSTATHTINNNIIGDDNGDPLEINPVNGNLIINGSINNNSSFIDIYGDNGNTLTVTGIISGTGGIALKQNSSLILTGNNTYTGTTVLENGRLILEGSLENSDVTIQSGAVLEINGNVTVKSVTVEAGGQIDMKNGQNLTITDFIILNGGIEDEDDTLGNGEGTLTISSNAKMTISEGGYTDIAPTYTSGSILEFKDITTIPYNRYTEWLEGSTVGYGVPDHILIDNATYDLNITPIAQNTVETLYAGSIELINGGKLIINETKSLDISGGLTINGTSEVELNSVSDLYPSLLVGGTSTGTVTYNRYTAEVGPTGTNDLVAPPVNVADFSVFATNNSNLATNGSTTAAFATWDPTDGTYDNLLTTDTGSLSVGTGYRAGTTDGSPLSYTGTVSTGPVSIPIDDGTSSFWNLVGNPYPSYVSATAFLSANNATLNPTFFGIYGYDADAIEGGSIWTIVDANFLESAPNYQITPGQGFFVAAPSGGGTSVSFTTAMQETGTSDDFIAGRQAASTNDNFARAILNLNTASTTYVTNVYFRDINTQGLDPGYDTGAYDGTAAGIYTQLVQDNAGVNLYNQSLPFSDLGNIVVPVAVNASQGVQLTFALNATSDLPTDINVYLEDNVANTWTLLNNQDYILTPSVDLNGVGRFFIHFSNTTLSNEAISLSGLQIFAPDHAKTVVVQGPLQPNTTLSVFDMQGRLVQQQALDAGTTQNTVGVSNLTPGVYVVQVRNAVQNRTQKVVIR